MFHFALAGRFVFAFWIFLLTLSAFSKLLFQSAKSNSTLFAIVELAIVLFVVIRGEKSRLSQVAILLTVVAFAGWNGWHIANGDAGDCNCFGRISVNTQFLFFVELASVPFLIVHLVVINARLPDLRLLRGFCFLIVSGVLLASSGFRPSNQPVGMFQSFDDPQVIITDDIFQAYPQCMRGDWKVFVYSHDCSHCMEALGELIKENESRFVLCEVDSRHHDLALLAAESLNNVLLFENDRSIEMHGELPMIFSVTDGDVRLLENLTSPQSKFEIE